MFSNTTKEFLQLLENISNNPLPSPPTLESSGLMYACINLHAQMSHQNGETEPNP